MMRKIFLHIISMAALLSGIKASSEIDVSLQRGINCSSALRILSTTICEGPSEIEPLAPTGELRGFTFGPFDKDLYRFFERREFDTGRSYRLLDYACGTGRWSAMAALQGELDKRNVTYIARDAFMQAEHAGYYNRAWSTYIRENGSSYGSLSVGQSWLKDVATSPEKYNGILVRDAIHLFSDKQLAELFQLASQMIEENGSLVLQAAPPFANTLWNPQLRLVMHQNGLTPPNFGDIFFNTFNYRTYSETIAALLPEDHKIYGELGKRSVCLPAIRNAAESNGWWLQAIQVGRTLMTHKKPLSEEQLYTFVLEQVGKKAPRPEGYSVAYTPEETGIILRFKNAVHCN